MREPDQTITRRGDGTNTPYMLRWFLFRSQRHDWMPRLYLHKFLRSDDDRAPHDHPWWFISVLLRGKYIEHRWSLEGEEAMPVVRRAPSIAFRGLNTRHRVELFATGQILRKIERGSDGPGIVAAMSFQFNPVWTIVLTGPDVRGWGFWCNGEKIPWRQFDGCGE